MLKSYLQNICTHGTLTFGLYRLNWDNGLSISSLFYSIMIDVMDLYLCVIKLNELNYLKAAAYLTTDIVL